MKKCVDLFLDLIFNFILTSIAVLCFIGGQVFPGVIVVILITLANAWTPRG